jgi:molybdopterin converting factor small subunit
MEISVKLFATLQKGRFESARINLDQKSSIADLLEKLHILPSDVGILVVNDRDATFNQTLHEDDAVTIIPAIGGG